MSLKSCISGVSKRFVANAIHRDENQKLIENKFNSLYSLYKDETIGMNTEDIAVNKVIFSTFGEANNHFSHLNEDNVKIARDKFISSISSFDDYDDFVSKASNQELKRVNSTIDRMAYSYVKAIENNKWLD